MINPIKHILLLLLVLFPLIISAQLEIKKNENASYDEDNNIFKLRFTVINHGDLDVNFYWTIETDLISQNAGNITSIYDQVICYPGDNLSLTCDDDALINFIAAGDSITYYAVDIRPSDTFEKACLTWKLLDACVDDTPNVLAEVTCKFDKEMLTLASEPSVDSSSILVYPNPTKGSVRLSRDASIVSIGLYEISGQLIEKVQHYSGDDYLIPHIEEGIYFIRLFDMNDRVVQTTTLLYLGD